MAITLCKIDGCSKKHKAKGLCAMHYRRLLVHGDPLIVKAIRSSKGATLVERFWSKVDKSGDCWNWMAHKNAEGYGVFRVGGVIKKAHRWSLEQSGEKLDPLLEVHHKCFNTSCVNPEHLEQVSQATNAFLRGGANSNSKSGIRGLVWLHKESRWLAYYSLEGVRYCKRFMLDEKADAESWLRQHRDKHSV